MNLTDLLTAPRVVAADAQLLATLYRWVGGPPRYWRSPSYLCSDSANRLHVTDDGCVLLLRVKVLHGRPVAYLLVPPMGPSQKAERAVLLRCAELGVGAKLSEYDMRWYGVQARLDRANVEYLYRGGPAVGSRGQARRTGLNRLQRHLKAGSLRLYTSARLDADMAAACVACADTWYRQRHAASGTRRVVAAFAALSLRGVRQLVHVVLAGDRVVGLSLSEVVGPGQVARVCEVHDYSEPLAAQLTHALHELDCRAWSGWQLTMGGAVGVPGLAAHKATGLLGEPLQLYHLEPAIKLTLDEYRAATAPAQMELT